MQKRIIVFIIAVAFVANLDLLAQGIKIYQKNPFYWEYKNQPNLLIGGTSTNAIFLLEKEELKQQLDWLASIGGNYSRVTMSGGRGNDPRPFIMENGKYNLDKPNPEYWEDKFDRYLSMAYEKGIISQIEIWATYNFYNFGWEGNVWNPKNNSIFDTNNSQLTEVINHSAQMKVNAFFETVPNLNNDKHVLKYQQKFVDLLLSYSLKYDNILYCIDNETNAAPGWGAYWAEYIKEKAGGINKTIYVTEMWDNWDPTDGAVEGVRRQDELTHPFLDRSKAANTINNPGLYDYVDISNTNANNGEPHYQAALYVRNWIEKTGIIRPINNDKIYGHTMDSDGGEDWAGFFKDGEERFWRDIFAGHASVRFHRQNMGLGNTVFAEPQIKSLRIFTDSIDIFNNVPANNLLLEREPNEAFCMALDIPSKYQYAIYFPGEGSVKLRLPNRGSYELHWLHIRSSQWRFETEILKAWSQTIQINTPDKDQWAVIVKKVFSPESGF